VSDRSGATTRRSILHLKRTHEAFRPRINDDRADWARLAVFAYAKATGDDYPEVIANLIARIGHYCERKSLDYLNLIGRGVGMWSAESRAPEGEPFMNDIATITIEEWKEPQHEP
jgi:hypothetical protein